MVMVMVMGGLLLIATGARAQKDADAAFRDFATKYAAENNQYVESWWSANLDQQPGLERVAVLCPTDKDGAKGSFLIEKDAEHRWELTFDFDSRTKACKGKPAAPPKLEERKTTTIDLYQGHNKGHEMTSYGIRIGKIVIVREETDTGSGKTEVQDWDAAVKKKKGTPYQIPEAVRSLNN